MKRSIALIAMLCASTALAEVGTIEQAENGFIIREGDRIAAESGEPVEQGDLLETTDIGLMHVLLNDETRVVVGPGTSLSIDAALVGDDDGTFENLAVGFTVGIMRMITGNSESEAYNIETPTSTLGIRGSAFEMRRPENAGQPDSAPDDGSQPPVPQDGAPPNAILDKVVFTEGVGLLCKKLPGGEVDLSTCLLVPADECAVIATFDQETGRPEDQSLRDFMLPRQSELNILEDYLLDLEACAAAGKIGGASNNDQAPGENPQQPENEDEGNNQVPGTTPTTPSQARNQDPTLPSRTSSSTFSGSGSSFTNSQICTEIVVLATLEFEADALQLQIDAATTEEEITRLTAEQAQILATITQIETEGFSEKFCDPLQAPGLCLPGFTPSGECCPPGLEGQPGGCCPPGLIRQGAICLPPG
ncbi:FecR family protein [Ovoidimarina sediminis]|uniref:hypothetical protein n=1 Tax=Ovoidimarina sediminis TaxID=3079856 RepID=UPI0029148006|nr:hypothetical protein [Rhodophyticola sp. MJ-SS7]MDU8944949.1 hypothetical protein [Rhodophyticola sp. MJ-SS7]